MVQPGVGVNVVAGDGWGFVGQVDYRRTFFDEDADTFLEAAMSDFNDSLRVFVGVRMLLD